MQHALPSLLVAAAGTAALAAQAGWAVPSREAALNSSATESGPHLSVDGLVLHFASYRSGNFEIYSSTRTAPGQPWSAPVREVDLGSVGVEAEPWLSADGLEIWFSVSNRVGGTGGSDLMHADRATLTSSWNPPTFVAELNSSLAETAPSVTADGLEIFFYSTGWGNASASTNSLFTARRLGPGQPFGVPVIVAEFRGTNSHRDVDISGDGLSIVFTEYVTPRFRVMFSERLSRSSPWDAPVAWAEFDSVGSNSGVYGFTRSAGTDEAFLSAGFPTASGGQELLRTTFTGLTHQGLAGLGSTMTLGIHVAQSPGQFFSLGAALGNTGFPIGARIVPLDPDWLLFATFGTSVPGYTSGWGGQLDAAGNAYATLTNSLPALTGLVIHLGGLTWDSNQPFGVGTITNSFPVLFQ